LEQNPAIALSCIFVFAVLPAPDEVQSRKIQRTDWIDPLKP